MIFVEQAHEFLPGTELEGVSKYYSFSIEDRFVGTARFDITPRAIMFHPILLDLKDRKEFLFDCTILAKGLIKKYGFDRLLYYTKNNKLVKVMSKGKAILAGKTHGYTVYAHMYEDI